MEVPPMPNLRSFTMTDYDPLCFPDDLSTMFLHATRLEAIKLHFSPRMREAAEPSVQLSNFLRKAIAAKRKWKMKEVGMYNLFASSGRGETDLCMDFSGMRRATFINTFGSDESGPSPLSTGPVQMFDASWDRRPPDAVGIKYVRHDRLHKSFADTLHQNSGLEQLFLINARQHQSNGVNGITPPSAGSTPGRGPKTTNLELRDIYLDGICSNHGDTLRHLIFPARWPLSAPLIGRLFRACPNITQLSFAMDCQDFAGVRLLVPFLKKLWAIRLMRPENSNSEITEAFDSMENSQKHEMVMGKAFVQRDEFPRLRYIGIGTRTFEIGGWENVELSDQQMQPRTGSRRKTQEIDISEVREIEIWKMDSLDVI